MAEPATIAQPQASAIEPIAYRMRDAEKASGISKSKLYELAAADKLRLSRVGGRTLVPRNELLRLIAEGQRDE